jgi:hypothetical protein
MKCEDLDRYLDDYLDGALKADRAKDVERHLESCPECLNKKDALLRLLERLGALPKEVETFHDLWPEIRERIEQRQAGRSGQVDNVTTARKRIFPLWAAAAVVLIGVLVYWVTQMPGDMSRNEYGMSDLQETTTAPPIETILADYISTRDMLFAELEKRREELDPETVTVVMENMRIMDQATVQIREALKKDPRNRGLERMLMASYNKQVRLLRQANNIPSGMER